MIEQLGYAGLALFKWLILLGFALFLIICFLQVIVAAGAIIISLICAFWEWVKGPFQTRPEEKG